MRKPPHRRSHLSYAAMSLAMLSGLGTHTANAQESGEADAVQDKIVVTGRRVSETDLAIGQDQASNTVAVTRQELLSAPAGISGLKMLETLPGFNVQTDGALGLYEFGNSVTVRAFNLQQIGFVLDGVPMGRSDAFGGSPIFRYVDNENLGSVVASPGAGDVSLPSYASLGPIVSYNTVDTAEEFGGTLAYTLGDDDLQRSFIKLETGRIGGFSAYASRSKTDSGLWRGAGSIDREHIEGKIKYEFDEDTFLQATYVSNEFFDYDSPSGPEAVFENDYYYGYSGTIPDGCIMPMDSAPYDYDGDGDIDGDDFVPAFVGPTCTSYYQDRINIRQDALYSLAFETDIVEGLNLSARYYFEDKDGFGVSPDSYANTEGRYLDQVEVGLDVSPPRGVQYGLSTVGGERQGALVGLTWQVANHTLEGGVWYEDEDYNRTQQRLNKVGGAQDGAVLFDEVAYYRRNYSSVRETVQLYLKDTVSLLQDRLNIEVGAKSLSIDYSLSGYRDYNDYAIRVGAPGGGDTIAGYGPQSLQKYYEESFLPMVGAVFDVNGTDQVFASYSQNFALPRGADDVFSVANDNLAPAPEGEESQNYEIGYRTNRPQFNGAAAIFYTTFDNRLVGSSSLNPATGQPESIYINAGETEAYGFELSGVYQPAFLQDKVYANGNLTYNHAESKDSFAGNPAGSLLADSPEWLFTGGVTYEPTEWAVANFSWKYTGERYADYSESYQMDAYTTTSAYLDLGGPNNFGIPENVRLRFNLDNVFDEEVPTAFVFAGNAFFRPLNPRTFSVTFTADF